MFGPKRISKIFSRVLLAAALMLCVSCEKTPADQDAEAPKLELNTRLVSFAQRITSPVSEITVKPNELFYLPVTIMNPGKEAWGRGGTHFVDLSYQWISDGKILPIEGQRTPLPKDVNPGQSIPVNAAVIAPAGGTDLILSFTMVQEGVTWFSTARSETLKIPTKLE